ncbi:hypothetical protein DOTSEDRAFT_47922 [Dothistroma septosporum NZE10]|uniref:Uncharacterized protein n=1 Tax=Dothistroma septosporum (strain NZE10 / CBS 128990) TaxID=675120 RepID=M2Y265_DOTSN|nr:hypothetical protein DOTSEDRAFT_47922 [Dothistroma septosporum NZE10]
MASATATATMAAAGFNKKARDSAASSLQTPGSGTFPSEMLSPMAPSPSFKKREDALKTPITPPSAYLDFLKNYSSTGLMSPAPTGTSSRFSFNDHSFDKSSDKASEVAKSSMTPPTSQPALSRNTSYDSNGTDQSNTSSTGGATAQLRRGSRPDSPRIIIPPSTFAKPAPRSARTPRRLAIPQSPFSPALGSALTTASMPSPYSSTPLSAAPWSASFSPREHSDAINQPGKVHVRHVVTRTVTYCRTPLVEPAPRGKRRKLDTDEADSKASSHKASSEEPSIKQERIEEVVTESSSSEA